MPRWSHGEGRAAAEGAGGDGVQGGGAGQQGEGLRAVRAVVAAERGQPRVERGGGGADPVVVRPVHEAVAGGAADHVVAPADHGRVVAHVGLGRGGVAGDDRPRQRQRPVGAEDAAADRSVAPLPLIVVAVIVAWL